MRLPTTVDEDTTMGFLSWIRDKFSTRADIGAGPELEVALTATDAKDANQLDAEQSQRRFGPFPTQQAFDAVANWMTGQGGVGDPAMATAYLYAATTDWQTLRNMCRVSWLARKIVWKKPRDIMRPGYSLVWEGAGDKREGAVDTDADRVRRAIVQKWDANNKLIEAMAWAREFGGSIIVIGIKGQNLEEPLPIKDGRVDYSVIGKGSLQSLMVWDRWRANHDGEMDWDPNSPNRGRPKFYVISADGGMTGQRVHWTRAIRFDGDTVDWWTWIANACWHDSVLQVVIDRLKQYDTLSNAISSLVPKARRDVVYAEGAAKAASTAEGRAAMSARYQAVHQRAGIWQMAVYDKDKEKLEQQTYNFANLDKIWEKSMREVGGACGYPVSILFDDQPSGLNADGTASQQNYYDDLGAERESMLQPRHLALLEVIVRDELGMLPAGFSIKYGQFRTPSVLEAAQINKMNAEADHIRIEDKIITPERAMAECKEHSVYTTATQEDVDAAKKATEAAAKAAEAGQAALAAGAKVNPEPGAPGEKTPPAEEDAA